MFSKITPSNKVRLKDMKMGTPPRSGIGFLWIFLSEGKSQIFAFFANNRTIGVIVKESPMEIKKKNKYLVIYSHRFNAIKKITFTLKKITIDFLRRQ